MRHPVLGPVACLVAVKQIAKGEEVFIFYHRLFLVAWHCQETGDVFFLIQSVFGCMRLPRKSRCVDTDVFFVHRYWWTTVTVWTQHHLGTERSSEEPSRNTRGSKSPRNKKMILKNHSITVLK